MNEVAEYKLTPEDAKVIAKEGYSDPVYFLRFFLSHKFPKPIPWVHRATLAILTGKTEFLKKYGELDKIFSNFLYREDPSNEKSDLLPIFYMQDDKIKIKEGKFNLMMLPRGFSKTTLAGQGVILYWTLYREHRFPVYISETQTHAETQVTNVANELEFNPRIIAVFGEIKPDRQSRLKWTQEIIQTTTGCTIAARGRGTQIRGMNVDGHRPDVLLLDDVEDRESVKTAEQRKKTKDWAYGDVIPALPEMDETATIVALGTLLHREALLNIWRSDPDWISIVFGARDIQGDPLWADNMSNEKIDKKKAMYARVGQLAQYYLEYENTVRNDESSKFQQASIIYEPITRDKLIGCAVAADPAISEKRRACPTAIAVAGMTENGLICVMDYWQKVGASPTELLDKFFEFQLKWDCTAAGIEAIQYQAALIHIAKEWMFRKGRYFEIQKLTHTAKKEDRIEGILQPRYASGFMRHIRCFPELETQLLDWPNGLKDGPDVLSMAVALLDPYAPAAANTAEGKDLGDDEMEPLAIVFADKRGRQQDWRPH